MVRLLRSRTAVAVIAFAVGASLAGGLAWASIPNSKTGVISACYKTGTPNQGALRVIDSQAGAKCASGEKALGWNQIGPRGPQGTPGSTGARGPSDLWNVFAGAKLPGFTQTNVAQLTLPAGRYLVSAHVSVTNFTTNAGPLQCWLYVNYNDSFSNPIDSASEQLAAVNNTAYETNFPLQGSVYYTSAGYAIVACKWSQNSSTSTVPGASATLNAIAVTTIH
jgi:hypothetical protein